MTNKRAGIGGFIIILLIFLLAIILIVGTYLIFSGKSLTDLFSKQGRTNQGVSPQSGQTSNDNQSSKTNDTSLNIWSTSSTGNVNNLPSPPPLPAPS